MTYPAKFRLGYPQSCIWSVIHAGCILGVICLSYYFLFSTLFADPFKFSSTGRFQISYTSNGNWSLWSWLRSVRHTHSKTFIAQQYFPLINHAWLLACLFVYRLEILLKDKLGLVSHAVCVHFHRVTPTPRKQSSLHILCGCIVWSKSSIA